MFRDNCSTAFKAFITLMFCIVLSISSFARLGSNGSGSGYDDPDQTVTESDIKMSVIETYVEQGAASLFDAYSDYMDFSKSFELQDQMGVDFNEWQIKINSTLTNIKKAKSIYNLLIKEAELTPYNWRIIYRLWFFDYHEFRVRKGLNASIFREVESYLSLGDITGLYKKNYNDLVDLERMLMEVMRSIEAMEKPALENLWDLNDAFAHTVTFGQYVSRVFYALN